MSDVRCKISLRQDMNAYLSVWKSNHDDIWCLCVRPLNDSNGTDWILRDIPGSRAKFLIKDGGSGGGDYVTWVGGNDRIMLVRPHRDGWEEQVVLLDDAGDGFVAVNNHDRDRVMDRSEAKVTDPFVVSFPWNGGDNQQWFIREH